LERLQQPGTARHACREVAQRLAAMLTEKAAPESESR
jgi:hypothetical protein